MAWAPRLSHLIKILLRRRDPAAAEGLFLEGSIEFENGDAETARLMFLYGTRLDPDMAGNFYNLAVATEKLDGNSPRTLAAWEAYLAAAERDPRQPQETRNKVREHVRTLKADPRT
ncbi:MAG: hypothetical protein KF858_04660 [Candidatus Sumerlaeia bacterium]|nr:hypothetical protein [Candidatus Sumerlaeia bacterium]